MKGLFQTFVDPYYVNVTRITDTVITLIAPDSRVSTGFGDIIEQFSDEDFAIKQGERFARNLKIAIEEGYHLHGNEFRNPSGREIHASFALDTDRSPDNFRRLLRGETD